jgi:hypothetical protein
MATGSGSFSNDPLKTKEISTMRHADAELQLWLANDRISREHRDAELVRHVREARHGGETPTIRQRAGTALIAFGERLAGTRSGTQGRQRGERRVAARLS